MAQQRRIDLVLDSVKRLLRIGATANLLNLLQKQHPADLAQIFSELPAYAGFYFTEEIDCNPEGVAKYFTAENKPRLAAVRDTFAALNSFDAASVESAR